MAIGTPREDLLKSSKL